MPALMAKGGSNSPGTAKNKAILAVRPPDESDYEQQIHAHMNDGSLQNNLARSASAANLTPNHEVQQLLSARQDKDDGGVERKIRRSLTRQATKALVQEEVLKRNDTKTLKHIGAPCKED